MKHWSHSNSERSIWDSLSKKEVLRIDPFWLQWFFSSVFINDLYEEIQNAFFKLAEDKILRGLCVLWNTFFKYITFSPIYFRNNLDQLQHIQRKARKIVKIEAKTFSTRKNRENHVSETEVEIKNKCNNSLQLHKGLL